jgi:hypothetical protein
VAVALSPAADRAPPLDELLKTYRQLGLPLPAADAKLVRLETSWSISVAPGKDVPLYALGFLLRAATKEKPPLLLVGTQEYEPEDRNLKITPVQPEAALANEVQAEWMDSVFGVNAGLATALQCEARGWKELAQALWDRSIRTTAGHNHSNFYQPANLPANTALANVAWAHWGNELIKPDTDRAAISKRMKALLDAEPKLATNLNKAMLRSLELALVPSKAKPGSVEELIDGLVELAYEPPAGRPRVPPPYQRLADLGFAAVPALIEHLDDDRLTRTVLVGFDNFPTYHRRVGEVVGDLLQELAGEELGKDWLRRRQGYNVDKADARAWWEKAEKVGEEAYLLQRVLPDGPKDVWPNQHMLNLIAKKYPKHLPTVYRTLLDKRPHMQSWPVAEAVAKSSLLAGQKKELFLHAVENKELEHRVRGLRHLRDLDEPQFVKLLIANLKSLPRTPREPYWTCGESLIAHLVLLTEDREAWLTLTEAARRADVGLRMEYMKPMNYTNVGDRARKRRLDFLAAFLDDAAVRDEKADPEKFTGPYAGFTFPSLAVRDLAAMQIASILKLEVEPKPDWSKERWAKLREQVKEALKREGL